MLNHANYEKTPRLTSARGRQLSGSGLVTRSVEEHPRQRRLLRPMFLRSTMAEFAASIVTSAEATAAGWYPGGQIDVAAEMTSLAQRIIGQVLFSVDLIDDARELGEAFRTRRRYIQHVFRSLLPVPESLPLPLHRGYRRALRRIDTALSAMIRERRESAAAPRDLLWMLSQARYEDGAAMTERQIRDEALTLAVTGYETLGEALTWTWYLLSLHPQVERELLTELQRVLAGRTPGADDLPELRYAEQVLNESMRLFPPTWLFVRVARATDRLPSGATIPAGTQLYLCPYVVHRSARFYPDPGRFDPRRFTEAEKRARPHFAYFPFGGGPRTCIAQAFARMEGALVLASLVPRFHLALAPGQNVVPDPGITLRPRGPIRMHVCRQYGMLDETEDTRLLRHTADL